MPKLTIDGREVEVDPGATILDAAEKLGIEIPTMCYLRGHEATTSCMVCVVKVVGSRGLVPSCGTPACDGMQVESATEEVRDARRSALELLLSDHVGDCVGPCVMGCPAHMDIPQMIRQIAVGQLADAIATVKRDIALPAVLGRICPAPCENVCRRAQHDQAVSICLLKRHVADVDLSSDEPYTPQCAEANGKRVAIIGAGPAGLAAAYYLQQEGFECVVVDEHDEPGGMLRYGVPDGKLPHDVLAREIAQIEKLGVRFRLGIRVGKAISMDEVRKQFDAVFVAVGEMNEGDAESLHLDPSDKIEVDGATYVTHVPGVFAGGDAVRRRRMAVRAVADGKEAARSIAQYLADQEVIGPERRFNSRMGKVSESEMAIFLQSGSPKPRTKPFGVAEAFSIAEARTESLRCLHCDCRKPDACLLRQHAQTYGARQSRYKADRRSFVQQTQHPDVIYEPGKCIDCGICIQIASEAGEKLGLTFVGRGFDVRVAVPFGETLAEGLCVAAERCVAACPTGALAFRDDRKPPPGTTQ
ncbi:FAD-dependent oxidoreductase [Anaerobaca lacustris]|uniref:FAD-dependent oxidoreductase n=1 Tax=Anaerobaca lacustris TaxID=3044600 RepID=A0AAW6TWL0_9BACT|nr:FAD-dependent oxidoreductase [Sedimentisphaerales bacterium M17dextr]